jgi:hypothetical protein
MADLTLYGGNGPNKPATGMRWDEALRFVNYLNVSSGNTAAYKFDQEGKFQLWSPTDSGYNANNQYRNSLAKYFLPNVDEWYKAAYGSPSGTWYDYPNGRDLPPSPVTSGTTQGTAVYMFATGPADITQAGGLSPWGTMAQGFNVSEWGEENIYRGGSWGYQGDDSDPAACFEIGFWDATNGLNELGFRVAMIPEPSSLSLLALGGVVVALGRRKRA